MALLPTTLPLNLAAVCLAIGLLLCVAESGEMLGLGLGLGLVKQQREFDYFQLALQWPATFCRRTRHCCSTNGCCRSSNAPVEFTIHGLWPDYNDGTWPSCCTGKKFDEKEISTLLGALNKYWPSLSCSSPSNCHGGKGLFWEHEWEAQTASLVWGEQITRGKEPNFSSTSLSSEKHGTCSSSVTRDEYTYFVTALNVYFKYNVTEVLREAGYVASNSEKYPLGGIVEAIQNAFHATPELVCSGGAVQELYLCFYKDFKPRDCATKSNRKSCPRYVSLPEFSPLRMANSGNEVYNSTLDSVI